MNSRWSLRIKSQCQQEFACTGTHQSRCKDLRGVWPCVCWGRRWRLDVEAILKINNNGIDCFRGITPVCQRLSRLFTKTALQWSTENFLLISHLASSHGVPLSKNSDGTSLLYLKGCVTWLSGEGNQDSAEMAVKEPLVRMLKADRPWALRAPAVIYYRAKRTPGLLCGVQAVIANHAHQWLFQGL